MRYRWRHALPDVRARALSIRHTRSCHAVIGRHRDRGLPSASACSPRCTRAAVAACPPLVEVPRAHRLDVFIYRRSRPGITNRFTYDKRSAYLLTVTVWRVDNYSFLFMHRARTAGSQVKALLSATAGCTIPSISHGAHRLCVVLHKSSTWPCTASQQVHDPSDDRVRRCSHVSQPRSRPLA